MGWIIIGHWQSSRIIKNPCLEKSQGRVSKWWSRRWPVVICWRWMEYSRCCAIPGHLSKLSICWIVIYGWMVKLMTRMMVMLLQAEGEDETVRYNSLISSKSWNHSNIIMWLSVGVLPYWDTSLGVNTTIFLFLDKKYLFYCPISVPVSPMSYVMGYQISRKFEIWLNIYSYGGTTYGLYGKL